MDKIKSMETRKTEEWRVRVNGLKGQSD